MYGEKGLNTYRISREQESVGYLSSAVQHLFPKAQELVSGFTPDPYSFSEYPEREKVSDIRWAEQIKQKNISESSPEVMVQRQYAAVMEAILLQHGELSEWFGEGVFTVKTTDFDDLRNGLDIVLSLPSKNGSLERQHIGIDVTFSQHSLAKKLGRGYDEVCHGKLATVKYYACEDADEKGLIQVPRITLAITREHVTELAGLWMNNKNKELGNHAVKEIFLREIEAQLLYFMTGAAKYGRAELQGQLRDLRDTIMRVRINGRNGTEKKASFLSEQDHVADSLFRQCEVEK